MFELIEPWFHNISITRVNYVYMTCIIYDQGAFVQTGN
jgi:hypothetical protein